MNASDYSALATHDLDALRLLSVAASGQEPQVDVSDWKCTLMFYMACIKVKAAGMTRNVVLKDHYGLRQWINTTADLLPMTRPYRKLEEFSREARYEGRRFSASELQMALRWFFDVRDHIDGLLHAAGVTTVPVIDPSPYL